MYKKVNCSIKTRFWLLPLKNCNSTSIFNIPVKESVTYLGIAINKYTSNRCPTNFNHIIEKTAKIPLLAPERLVTLPETDPLPLEPVQTEVGRICFSVKKNNNRIVLALYQKEIISTNNDVSYWNNIFKNLNWKNIRSLPCKYFKSQIKSSSTESIPPSYLYKDIKKKKRHQWILPLV